MEWVILCVGTINLFLALFVAFKIPRTNFIRNSFIAFAFITSLWLFSNVILAKTMSFFWFKTAYAFGTLMISSALVLTVSFSIRKKLSYIWFLFFHGLGILFFYSCYINKLFFINISDSIKSIDSVGYTPLFTIYSVYLFLALLFILFRMLYCTKKFKGMEKTQARYIFLGVLAFGTWAFFVSFFLPMFGYAQYTLLDTCGTLFFVGMTAYAIIRYHLMGIDIVIKRSSIYTLMMIFVIGIYIASIFIFENLFQQFAGYYSLVSRIAAGFIIAITFLPIRNKLEKIIDKLFFRNKYEYFQSLHNLSQSLITILDLRELMGTIVKSISHILQVDEICLLFNNTKTKSYQVKAYVGFDDHIRKVKLTNRNKLLKWLKKGSNAAIKKNFTNRPNDSLSLNIIPQMERFKAEIVLPLFFNKQMIGILTIGNKKSGDIYSLEDLNLLTSMGDQASIAFANAISYDNLKRTYLGTIEAFIKSIEAKDRYTWGHSERVVQFALKIAIKMNISREKIELLKYAGFLHDIGKIVIDSYILNKPDLLTGLEYEEVKRHPEVGRDIISQVKFLEDVGTIILYHHERWDGKGYPHQLTKKKTPLLSRILCVADAFDAMTSNRPYRLKLSFTDAVEEIKQNSGTQFDPSIVKNFVKAFK